MSLHLSNLAKLRTRQSREAVGADPVVPHVVLRLLLLLVVLLPHQLLLLLVIDKVEVLTVMGETQSAKVVLRRLRWVSTLCRARRRG